MSGGSRENLGAVDALDRNRWFGTLDRWGKGISGIAEVVLSRWPHFWGTLDHPDIRDNLEEVTLVLFIASCSSRI